MWFHGRHVSAHNSGVAEPCSDGPQRARPGFQVKNVFFGMCSLASNPQPDTSVTPLSCTSFGLPDTERGSWEKLDPTTDRGFYYLY